MATQSSELLTAVTDRSDVQKAYQLLRRKLGRGAERLQRRVSFRGGSSVEELFWRPKDRLWSVLSEGAPDAAHHWCAYGIEPGPPTASLSIVCEINPPHEGFDRHCAGAFLKDADGRFYLAHTGKVGGGQKGVGKTAFLQDYQCLEPFRWPDGRADQLIVVGRVGDPRFPRELGRFVRSVRDFKHAAKEKRTRPRANSLTNNVPRSLSFTPEFRGPRAIYEIHSSIEARCGHGLVVDALKAALELVAVKNRIHNDKYRDLFMLPGGASRSVLFEVKTDASTTSVYTGVGQLMLNGATEMEPPNRVLVLPARPTSATGAALESLAITVLTYEWAGSDPVFQQRDIRRVLAAR